MSKILPEKYRHPYTFDKKYKKSAVYFSMEFAIDQCLKIYSGGLGFLAGSHMRSAYDLKQNLIGIGILWKKGYYDQYLKEDLSMGSLFREKNYSFLEDTNIRFTIKINNHDVWIKAYFLKPEIFGTVPMFFLSTDLPENDYLAKSTTFRLYDSDPSAKIAQTMVLGLGGAKLLDALDYEPDIYHLNEAHAVSSVFHLYNKYKSVEKIKEKMVFTTHTPEEAGNEKHDIYLLENLSFFDGIPLETVREITGIQDNTFNHSLVALRLSHKANGVSKLHGEVSREMWKDFAGICPITHITNAQNKKYWVDPWLDDAHASKDREELINRKKRLKTKLFEVVADQTGKIFDPEVLTIVWARRFADYKRPDLITRNIEKFRSLMTDTKRPIQIIFAGKPYPTDYGAIHNFDNLSHISKEFKNMAVLIGHELKLSRQLKKGSDVWLNNPRVTREASGTSGVTAAMNGSINFSTNDGWVREFKDLNETQNSFVLPIVDHNIPTYQQDQMDLDNLYRMLEEEILPLYYDTPEDWWDLVETSMKQIVPFFDSARMVDEYYTKMYN
ncbi:alpha-glucan family phosphorylase [Flavobacterium taihuense]|uniref:Alpha-glucan family phosphorylase n=1 Tax=Flavobacterium taihuense TaxID=2857508 RepID=A0ABS6XWE2_9FLAO|nr:alpha-glucan family phosphorylase [Flavobacterium taihuense]MBW4360957.1 alpha-glucan family phosphorylase [Flavobacterium taihuense]